MVSLSWPSANVSAASVHPVLCASALGSAIDVHTSSNAVANSLPEFERLLGFMGPPDRWKFLAGRGGIKQDSYETIFPRKRTAAPPPKFQRASDFLRLASFYCGIVAFRCSVCQRLQTI